MGSKNIGEKNNNAALIIGVLLIAIVIVITIVRTGFSSDVSNTAENNSASAGLEKSSDDSNPISNSQLAEKARNKENIEIIDIRDADSFMLDHLLDSVNLEQSGLESYVSGSRKSENFIIVDEDGTVSPDLVKNLSKNHPDVKIYFLTGGYLAWKNQDFPTVSDGNPFSFVDQSKVKYINSDDLKKMIEKDGQEIFIIDVRKKDAYQEGHIKNAVNIYLGDIEQKRKEIPRGKKIILYDKDGLWAFKGAVKLFDAGIIGALALSDGLDVWKQKGFEIVK
jgi:rhodanese-related sulfurtransferase